MDPYGDIEVKARVDSGKMLGPNFYLTTPYLQGAPSLIPQMYELKDADDARAFVRYWHSVGFTSVKAYVDVTPDELRAGIDEAHKLNMKVTGHICSVGYNEAADMGIDNLEHGPFGAPDGELYSKRKPGICGPDYFAELRDIVMNVEPDSPQLKQTIQNLVAHHVAITSTLAVLEDGLRPPMSSALVARTQNVAGPGSLVQGHDQPRQQGSHGLVFPGAAAKRNEIRARVRRRRRRADGGMRSHRRWPHARGPGRSTQHRTAWSKLVSRQ